MAFLSGVAQGMAHGMASLPDIDRKKEEIKQLKQQGEQRREMFGLQKAGQQSQNEMLGLQINDLKRQNMEIIKTQIRDGSYDYLDKYFSGGDEKNPKYLTSAFVQNEVLNKQIANNKALGMNLGQITGVQDNEDGTLTFSNSLTGKEKTIPWDIFLIGTGYFNKRDAVQIEEAEKKYTENKQKWEVNKIKAQTYKEQMLAKKAKRAAEAPVSTGPSLDTIKDQLYIKEKLLNIKTKTNEANVKAGISELDNVSAVEGNEDLVYDTIIGNTALHKEIFPDESTKKIMREGRTAAKLSRRMTDFSDEIGKAIDEGKTGGLVNLAKNFFGKYNVGTDEAVKAAAEVEGLISKGESITADQLKLITGAAFNNVEMEVRLNALISAMRGYEGGNVSKEKLRQSLNEWKATASNYTLPLTKTQQAFIKGSLNKSDNQFDKEVKEPTPAKQYKIGGKTVTEGQTFKIKGKDYIVKNGTLEEVK